jgi:hypothetical protein
MNNYRIQKMPNCLILILNVMVSRKSEDAGVYRCGGRLRALNCWTQASEVKVTHPGSIVCTSTGVGRSLAWTSLGGAEGG